MYESGERICFFIMRDDKVVYSNTIYLCFVWIRKWIWDSGFEMICKGSVKKIKFLD